MSKNYVKSLNEGFERYVERMNEDLESSLIKEIKNNLNTDRGYKAFYELEKYITDNNKDTSILYDLAADFDWDDKLNDAVNKLAKEEGREDLVYESFNESLNDHIENIDEYEGFFWFEDDNGVDDHIIRFKVSPQLIVKLISKIKNIDEKDVTEDVIKDCKPTLDYCFENYLYDNPSEWFLDFTELHDSDGKDYNYSCYLTSDNKKLLKEFNHYLSEFNHLKESTPLKEKLLKENNEKEVFHNDNGQDYIVVERSVSGNNALLNKGNRWIIAWNCPKNNKGSWDQGHYFFDEESARKVWEDQYLNESSKRNRLHKRKLKESDNTRYGYEIANKDGVFDPDSDEAESGFKTEEEARKNAKQNYPGRKYRIYKESLRKRKLKESRKTLREWNDFPSRGIVDSIKKRYPAGTRVELVNMDDTHAPPVGTRGTVRGVDDIGSIMVDWDNGSSLSVAYGKDSVRIINENDLKSWLEKVRKNGNIDRELNDLFTDYEVDEHQFLLDIIEDATDDQKLRWIEMAHKLYGPDLD